MSDILSSHRIYIRELSDKDITDEYLRWFKDKVVIEFLEAKNIERRDVLEYIEFGKKHSIYYLYAICDKNSNEHIGNIKIGNIDRKHMISDLVTIIGNRNYWGKGLATEAIKLGNKLAFEKYDIRKLTGGMYSDNIASIKCYTRAGWVIEGVLKGHYLLNGKTLDRVCVSCFNPEIYDEDFMSSLSKK